MSRPSSWPLSAGATRYIAPRSVVQALAQHPLAWDLYPTCFGYYPSATGHRMERSTHDDWLLMYCVDGAATATVHGMEYVVKKGELLVLPHGVPHKYMASRAHPWSVYWVHFEGRQAQAFLDRVEGIDRPVLSLGVRQDMVTDFTRLISSLAHHQPWEAALYSAQVLRTLLGRLALYQTAPLASDTTLDVDKVQEVMATSLTADLDLNTLARTFHMSKYHFAKCYRQETGLSPIAHFINLKMERACWLLDSSKQSIAQIADALGYKDPYYFSRIFKSRLGYSPRQYRELNKG